MKRVIGLMLLVAMTCGLQASEDEIELVNPTVQMLGGVAVNGAQFDVSSGGAKTSFKADRIKSLVFDTELQDQDWIAGQKAFWESRWAVCYERLTPVIRLLDAGGEFREMCVPFAYYYYAVAAGQTNHNDVSQKYFKTLFDSPAFPKTHPLYSKALTDSAMLSLQAKNTSAAESLLPRLREVDATLGAFVAAEVAIAQNDLGKATGEFAKLASATDPIMKARGQMGATRVAIAKKEFDEAIKSATAAIAGGSGNDLIQSDGYYYLGVAQLAKAAVGKSDNEKATLMQQAGMAFMRVVAVYPTSDKRLAAADGAIKCFDQLAQFSTRMESLKATPYSKFAARLRNWKNANGGGGGA